MCGIEVINQQKIEKKLSTVTPRNSIYKKLLPEWFKNNIKLIYILHVVEAQDDILKKNYASQSLGSGTSHEAHVNAYHVRKDLKTKKIGKWEKGGV